MIPDERRKLLNERANAFNVGVGSQLGACKHISD
jgi:hypothetical protein